MIYRTVVERTHDVSNETVDALRKAAGLRKGQTVCTEMDDAGIKYSVDSSNPNIIRFGSSSMTFNKKITVVALTAATAIAIITAMIQPWFIIPEILFGIAMVSTVLSKLEDADEEEFESDIIRGWSMRIHKKRPYVMTFAVQNEDGSFTVKGRDGIVYNVTRK